MAEPITPVLKESPKSTSTTWDAVIQTRPLALTKTKLSRTSIHKVRTGCITCKKRHVKCDEARPSCNNCLRSRGHCEGYASEPRKRSPGQFQECWDSRQPIRISPPSTCLPMTPVRLDLGDSTGQLYFQEFLGLVQGPWVAGAAKGDLWSVTLPQLTHNDDKLRSAAMAIGALSIWHRQSTHSSLHGAAVPVLPVAEGDVHYFQAVSHYCQALKLQNKQASMQSTIFLSVLLLFFETLRGNRKTALEHINHGLALLFTVLSDDTTNHHISNFAPDPKPLLGAVADIFTQLATQIRTILPGRIDHGPPLPNLSKELRNKKETIESFMVVLSQLPNSSISIDNIPVVFSSLDECQEYRAAVRRKQTSMATIVADAMHSLGVPDSPDLDVVNNFYINLLGNPQIKDFCDVSRENMKRINDALVPLFNNVIMSGSESPTYLRALHLRLEVLGSYLFEDPPSYLSIQSLHSRTPQFREYLSIADMTMRLAKREIKNPAHQFSLQGGLSWQLFVVTWFCRDPLVRDQARWMLKDYPGQDGLWNVTGLYALALRNCHVERENLVDGTPHEQWRRLWRREYIFEEAGDRVIMRFLEKDHTTGLWDLVEEAAEINGESQDVVWKRQPLSGSGRPLLFDLYAR